MNDNLETLEELLNSINERIQGNHKQIKVFRKLLNELFDDNKKLIPQSEELYKKIQNIKAPKIEVSSLRSFASSNPDVNVNTMLNSIQTNSCSYYCNYNQTLERSSLSISKYNHNEAYINNLKDKLKPREVLIDGKKYVLGNDILEKIGV